MKIYFEPVVKKVRKSKKSKITTSASRTKDKECSNRNNVSEHTTTRKIRTKSAPQSSTTKTTRDYRPVTTGHTTRYTSDRRPPFPPKTAFVKQDVSKPAKENFSASRRPLVQNRLLRTSPGDGETSESPNNARHTQTGHSIRYKTCFSPLLDKGPIEFNDHESNRPSKITSTLIRTGSGCSSKVTGSDHGSFGKLTSKLTTEDLVSSKSATRSDFESFHKITGTTKLTVRDLVSNKFDSDSSGAGKCDANSVSRDCSSLHQDNKYESDHDTESSLSMSISAKDSSLSMSAKDSSNSESVTLYKIQKRKPSLSGTWNKTRAQQSDVKLTRGEVIEQSNRSRSIGDILSSINVYLPSLQTKIDKIEKDYSRLNSFLSVARMKIQTHVPTPETAERPGIVAWA